MYYGLFYFRYIDMEGYELYYLENFFYGEWYGLIEFFEENYEILDGWYFKCLLDFLGFCGGRSLYYGFRGGRFLENEVGLCGGWFFNDVVMGFRGGRFVENIEGFCGGRFVEYLIVDIDGLCGGRSVKEIGLRGGWIV